MNFTALCALHMALIWIEHWQADVAAGLKPTPESLASAERMIREYIAAIKTEAA